MALYARLHLFALLLTASAVCGAGEITKAPSGVKTGGQFIVKYDTSAETPPEHAFVFNALKEAMIFEKLTTPLNLVLHLPKDIPVIVKNCEAVNAFFDRGNNRIIFCNEFISAMVTKFQGLYETPEQVLNGVAGTVAFIFFHEVGHALTTNFNLPITGREEDAVDQLALFALMYDENPEQIGMLLEAAAYWGMYAEWEADVVVQEGKIKEDLAKVVFADEHSMGFQRFYNTLCWAYGANVEAHKAILDSGYLPEGRAAGCAEEYALLAGSWSRLLGPYLKDYDGAPLLRDAKGGGTIRVVYDGGPAASETDPLIKMLRDDKVIEAMAAPLAAALVIPRDITVSVADCSDRTEAYVRSEAKIVLCRQLVAEIAATFSKEYKGRAKAVAEGTIGTVLFYLYHQIGLALIDVLDLPVTGVAGDAVDQLSLWFLVQDGSLQAASYLMEAANYYGVVAAQGVAKQDTESLLQGQVDGQRFYNILCWAYGTKKLAYSGLVMLGLLPEARAPRCESEYQLLNGSWSRIIAPYVKPAS